MNYLETLKNIRKDKDKKIENIILLVVLLVILLFSMKYIFSPSSNSTSNNSNINSSEKEITNTSGANSITSNTNINQTNLEEKLSNVLSQISGISDVSLVITYTNESTTTPVYNTKDTEKSGEKTVEKSVAYNEEGSKKTAIIETVELPKVEGVIVVAHGANSVDMKSKIATAISTITSVPVYKVQVFEKNG